MRSELGERLRQIRTSTSRNQVQMAELLGVAQRTYAGYERGESEIGAEPLARLVSAGWNANWLLTGEGSERVYQVTAEVFAPPSQPVRAEDLSMAVQLAQEALDGATLPPPKYGELVALIYDALVHGLPSAQVIALARPAARGLKTGVSDGGQVVGGEGAGAAGGGRAAQKR